MRKDFLGGGANWYSNKLSYSNTLYDDNENGDSTDDKKIETLSYAVNKNYTGEKNSCDEAMILVGGSTATRLNAQVVSSTLDEITYRITFKLYDGFDFNANYKPTSDNAFSHLLKWFGTFLSWGLIDEFNWSSTVTYEITVPNLCSHESANYRWEYDGDGFVSADGEDIDKNSLSKIQGVRTDGTLYDPYYEMESMVRLEHNLPWAMEFKMKGSGNFVIAPTKSYSSGEPYLQKSHSHMVVAEYTYESTDTSTGEPKTTYGRNASGINLSEAGKEVGYKYSKWHVYRVENRIAEDGSNMLYLLIDGTEIGSLDQYFINTTGKFVDQETSWDYCNGKDFYANYLFSASFKFSKNVELEYLSIWENGEDNDRYSYFVEEKIKEPTCTENGISNYTCKICKASYQRIIEAMGHSEEIYPEKKATCTEEGLTEGKSCTICKEVIIPQETIAALGHKYDQELIIAPTCYERGYTAEVCTGCGEEQILTYEEATGHTWDDGKITKGRTLTKRGVRTFTCVDCEETRCEETPSLMDSCDKVVKKMEVLSNSIKRLLNKTVGLFRNLWK